MIIKDVGIAGTLESSDITISIEKNEGRGIEIFLKSTVKEQFGKQIMKVIEETLKEIGVTDVIVNANDKGALDCTIRARVLTAVYRAAKISEFQWEDR